ncbi:hypothetical protein PsorP6_006334 [Peronosclerospora sorghi]|uniref:Uncharacterized protein n=1 Tax=Peronosclerospora sorghi TaxID=230839 RepID=A0ACC0W3C9_9STRA|nr:hypothetical protein PsorP6_006334 [Peronosclerospora sorghi]
MPAGCGLVPTSSIGYTAVFGPGKNLLAHPHCSDRKYLIQLSDATAVLEDLGTLVIDSMQLIYQEDTEHIVQNVSTCSTDFRCRTSLLWLRNGTQVIMQRNLCLLFWRTS